jgi:PGF-CTERM protein
MFGFEAVDIQDWDLTNKDDSQSAAVEDDDSEQQPDQESGSDSVPGFGIPGTLAGFGSAGYMIKRRLSAGRSED